MPPIPWGTNLSTIAPVLLSTEDDVTAEAGDWTTAIESQVDGTPVPVQFSKTFDVVPSVRGALVVVLGVTPPSALELAYALTPGTPIETYTVEPGLLTTLAELVIPFEFIAPQADSLFKPPGKTPLIQIQPTGEDVTVKAVGSYGWFQLELGVD